MLLPGGRKQTGIHIQGLRQFPWLKTQTHTRAEVSICSETAAPSSGYGPEQRSPPREATWSRFYCLYTDIHEFNMQFQ